MDISNCGPMFAQLAPERQNLETVRSLHQTIISLRAALDKSRSELQSLREKVISQVDATLCADAIEKLSLENHILRQRILNQKVPGYVEQLQMLILESESSTQHKVHMDSLSTSEVKKDEVLSCESQKESENLVQLREISNEKNDTSVVKIENKESTMQLLSDEDHSQSSEGNHREVGTPQGNKTGGDSDNDSEELDDIELIFTTEETKELGVLQEDLVSITDTEAWQPNNTSVTQHAESHNFDEISRDSNQQGKESVCEDTNSQSLDTSFTRTWLHSVLVETDISKCGVVDENEIPSNVSRRNTLPNPLVYQPIIHREALPGTKSQLLGPVPANPRPLVVKFAPVINNVGQISENRKDDYKKSPVRPILVEKNTVKRESEAQTDISALPSHWKSESYLAHKVSTNFTTLPSKFALPIRKMNQNKYALKLSDKTQEARRTLLSDINFTSMVPELSRSADHLSQEKTQPFELDLLSSISPGLCKNFPRAYSYMKSTDKRENASDTGYMLSREYSTEPWEQCNCTYCGCMGSKTNTECYCATPRYQGSLTSIPYNSGYEYSDTKRRHSCKAASEINRNNPMAQRLTWGSVPSSPTHIHRPRTIHITSSYATPQSDVNLYSPNYWSSVHDSSYPKITRTANAKTKSKNKVKFQASSIKRVHHLSGQSLPDLRVDPDFDSGDSTDSLIDEAEEYLRRSIDSILTGTDWRRIGRYKQKRKILEPTLVQELIPPQSAQPFLPKIPRDLKLDYFVKIITAEGRVMVGKVRYVGPVTGKSEVHVGVDLPKNIGDSDGTFQGSRYFECDPDRAVFVPFKKVVMAWST